jgi:hypothetical protein
MITPLTPSRRETENSSAGTPDPNVRYGEDESIGDLDSRG